MDDIPMIRDMTKRCKGCGCYGFADGFNKDGLCVKCATDGIPAMETNDDDSEWGDW